LLFSVSKGQEQGESLCRVLLTRVRTSYIYKYVWWSQVSGHTC